MGSVVVRRGRCRAEDEEEGRAGGRGVQLRYARGSRASRVCARTSTHPRTNSCGSGLPASRAPAPDRRSLCAGRARSSSTLGFTTWRAVRRLTQVLRGRGAKRGELRGTACAGQGRASRARRGDSNGPGSSPRPREARSLLYENLCPAMDSCGVMGMFRGLSAGARTALRNS